LVNINLLPKEAANLPAPWCREYGGGDEPPQAAFEAGQERHTFPDLILPWFFAWEMPDRPAEGAFYPPDQSHQNKSATEAI